jgi:hypothetical protein
MESGRRQHRQEDEKVQVMRLPCAIHPRPFASQPISSASVCRLANPANNATNLWCVMPGADASPS